MNKDKHMKKAQDFCNEGSAYIHCEVKNGETQLAVGGDTRAVVYACYRTLKRISEITGLSVEDSIGVIEELYNMETIQGGKDNASER